MDTVKEGIFRLNTKPGHYDPLDDEKRPWVWNITVSRSISRDMQNHLNKLCEFTEKPKFIKVMPHKSEDGPIIKQLQDYLQKNGSNSGSSGGAAGAGKRRRNH